MKFDAYDLYLTYEPFSAAWYRAYREEHLRRYPHVDQITRDNLDQFVRRAEEREERKAVLAGAVERGVCRHCGGRIGRTDVEAAWRHLDRAGDAFCNRFADSSTAEPRAETADVSGS